MKSRLLVAAVGVPLLLYLVLLAPVWVLGVALTLLVLIGAWELLHCIGNRDKFLYALAMLGASVWELSYFTGVQRSWMLLFVVLLFGYAVFRGGEVKLQQILVTLFAMLAVPYALGALLRLEAVGYARVMLLLPLIFSFASDTGAFFAGLTLGKHKLAPKVSPKKTVEGAIGGLLGNALGGILFAVAVNSLGLSLSYGTMILTGILCSVVAQLGDLSFSLIKREFGIKDYGRLFFEHGGVLDRFDSVIFVAPVLELLLSVLG